MQPSLFIASASEAREIAYVVQAELEDDVDATIWSQGQFEPGHFNLEALLAAAGDYDFALVIFTGEDLTTSRGVTSPAPRDNLLFEFGLFMGVLGRQRTFLLYNRDDPPKLPSDLLGLGALTFGNRRDNQLRAALGPACQRIRERVRTHRERSENAGSDLSENTHFHLINQRSGKALDVAYAATDDGAPIQQYRFHGKEQQTWILHRVKGGYFQIISTESKKCVAVAGDSCEPGAAVIQWSNQGSEGQQWKFDRRRDGTYRIVSRLTGQCIAVENADFEDGARVIQYDCLNGDEQRWWLLSVSSI
jgi:hypothetical protein